MSPMQNWPDGETLAKAGLKHDAGKHEPSFVFEYFPRALLAVASVSGYGARKYARGGWRLVPNGIQRYTDALDRHRLAESLEYYDTRDSGLAHAAHLAWNALARLELMLRDRHIVDLTGNEIKDGKPVLGTSRERLA